MKQLLERILDKGVEIDVKARIALGDLDLLKLKAHMILSSFETATQAGLHFPRGTNFDAPGWQDLTTMEQCPVCCMKSTRADLEKYGCPWCGWNYRPNER